MSSIIAHTRLEFVRSNGNAFTIESSSGQAHRGVVENISTNSKINSFPTATCKLLISEQYPQIAELRREDYVSIYLRRDDTPFYLVFAGEITKWEVKHQKDANPFISFDAVSSFYKLSTAYVNYQDISHSESFRELLDALKTMAKINGQIIVDTDVNDSIYPLHFIGTPALCLLQSLLVLNDLVMDVPVGDTLGISKRSTKAKDLGEVHTLDSEDVLSWSIREGQDF